MSEGGQSDEGFPREEIEALWAPWRVEYYRAEHSSRRDFLAEAAAATDDAAHLVVARAPTAFLIMNKYPYSCGHLMAVPCRKAADIGELEEAEVLDLWRLACLAQRLLERCVRARGFNIGLNIGEAGGAGFASHLHLHIVPRWPGDSNFMPVVAGTRILPEALGPLYERLRAAVLEISPVNAPRS
ncbi:MAG: HIT domain-containing protein [Terrimicrobiaceae bacterium]|nr:HIT domain-containing protein [Terrimicrobiaceae bacterium]